MNIHDLTINQLKRAVAIKEQLSKLGDQLKSIFDGASRRLAVPNKRTMSASAKWKIAAAQKARWAKLRRGKPGSRSEKPAGAAAKKATNTSANARRSAKLKAYWASKKRAAKK
jgi:hypothetical protein